MIVIGLDLSMNCTGYAVVKADNNQVRLLKKGIIKAKSKESHGQRLKRQYDELKFLRELYPGAVIVKESVHPGRAKTAIILAKVHGIIDLLFNEEIIYEYPAVTIKLLIANKGNAKKHEVEEAVRGILAMHGIVDIKFETDDESDAAAVTLTYLVEKGVI